ncbi:uracil nucleotide/cysteinyl leukotriene receptor [Callorhinchus milii]|uniref:Uracil nucleotide/cysteinyl leukotriene receptor n=1 Tax=Callorhinchus milii TaxID=7868 RepID=A0A4W3IQQ6_CALMI|nr:uracil nucleotide/cysteinyl leukotriene receptor [Callorhinchus milii]|eukprot:gi/632934407/ref/XP_007882674.1/ PREDICTED: uracil nucleotide/cysteinyl leukotriene receptor [Callorhinchus milii]
MAYSVVFGNASSLQTEQCSQESVEENLFFSSFYGIVFVLAFVGNTLAVWVFSCDKNSNTTTNIYLMHLAVADLSYVLILPMRMVYHLSQNHWPFGEVPCRITGFLFYLNMYASIFFLTCISTDRFLAIVYPVKSMRIRKPLYANVICIVLWVVIVVGVAPMLGAPQTLRMDNTTTMCLQLYREKTSSFALVPLTVGFVIPFVITVTCYLLIIRSLRTGNRIEKHLKDKAIKMIILVLTIFLICFVPYHINRYVYILSASAAHSTCKGRKVIALSNRITSCLTSLNSCLDPVVYFFVGEKFRERFCHFVCGHRKRAQSVSHETKTNESSLSGKSEL